MIKRMLLASILLTGTSSLAVAGTPGSDAAGPARALHVSAPADGCWGETGEWLPGTLRIDDRGRQTGSETPAPEFRRAPASLDCALA